MQEMSGPRKNVVTLRYSYIQPLASSAELTICVWYAAVTIAMAATFHKVAFSCSF